MNRISFILILGIMLIAGCIESGSKTEEMKTTPVIDASKSEAANNTQTTATVCVETNNIVIYGNKSYSNKCLDKTTLETVSCDASVLSKQNITCKPGYECVVNSCEPATKKCTDSDGGAIKEVAGIVRYGLDEYLDKCMGGDTVVKEYFCEDNNVESVVLECKLGCAENIIGNNFGSIVGYCS